MKSLYLVLGAFWVWPALVCLGNANSLPFQELGQCVSELKSARATFESRVPFLFRRLDPALVQMSIGVDAIDSNRRLLKATYGSGVARTVDGHLLWNGLVGCREFKASYVKRTRLFFALFASMSLLLLILIVGPFVLPVHSEAEPSDDVGHPTTR